MLTPRFPYPPERGDTLRSWGVLCALAARNEVWLAALDRRRPTAEHVAKVRALCRDVAVFTRWEGSALLRGGLALLTGHSLTSGYHGDPRLLATIRRWQDTVGFDVLWTYSSALAPAAATLAGIAGLRRVLDLGDVDSAKWEAYAQRGLPPLRWLYHLEARRVARLEAEAVAAADICLLVNRRECDKLRRRLPDAPTGVLPTAIDVQQFAAPPGAELAPPRRPIVGMVGSMFYPPNVRAVNWFGRWVWPLVRRELPDAQWWIVGNRPVRAVRRWARQPGVLVTGYVSDVRPYLAQMRVFVNAVEGDIGVQSKLVVALASGRAAVVTPDVAAGIDYDDPPPFLIARSAPAFAEAVIRLLRDEPLARSLSGRARAAALARYGLAGQIELVERWLRFGQGDRPRQAASVPLPAQDSSWPAPLAGCMAGRS